MQYIIVAALTFGALFLIDKGCARIFRRQAQFHSGTAVRQKKGYAIAAVLLCLLGVLSLIQYFAEWEAVMLLGGIVVLAMGVGLAVYYLTSGIFYDDDSFVYMTFGKKAMTYRYADINAQKLYLIQGGGYVVELYMADGSSVQVQTGMDGAYPFLDKACHARFRQLGINSHECAWFDESKSCWFPPVEE